MAHAGGRPTDYKEEYCDKLIEHMKQGLSFEAFGGVVGVSKDTLYEWRKVYSQFSDSYKKGQSFSLIWWEQIGNAATVGKVPAFNATSWIFNMKNRFKWADKMELQGKNGAELSYTVRIIKEAEERNSDTISQHEGD